MILKFLDVVNHEGVFACLKSYWGFGVGKYAWRSSRRGCMVGSHGMSQKARVSAWLIP